MFYKVLSANSLVELQNIVNEHINSGYQLQGGLVVASTVTDQESGPIIPPGFVPGTTVNINEPQAADRWTKATPGGLRITYFQAVSRQTITFNPGATESPHIKDN